MLTEPTLTKLRTMRLLYFAEAYESQRDNPTFQAMSFDERLGFLVDKEHAAREDKKLKNALSVAKLRLSNATLEALDFSPKRALDKTTVKRLSSCAWVTDSAVVVITGATGTGKSFLACALAHEACRQGHSALYRRVPKLLEEFRVARAEGSLHKVFNRLLRADVLVLDDFAMAPLSDLDRREFLEVIEDRHDRKATLITSQLATERWHDFLADPTVADAICDRLLHRAIRFDLKGPSKRKPDLPTDLLSLRPIAILQSLPTPPLPAAN